MRQQFAIAAQHSGLGRDNLTTLRDDVRLGADAAGVGTPCRISVVWVMIWLFPCAWKPCICIYL
jgi:hypothetical protein